MLHSAARCRETLNQVRRQPLPQRVAARVDEDERLFTYGERTLLYYDALVRTYRAARADDTSGARAAYAEAKKLSELLAADTTSTAFSSSHASAKNALAASNAAGALAQLAMLLGPPSIDSLPRFSPSDGPLTLSGKELEGGGALVYGYGIHAHPGRVKVSEVGNYVYARPNNPYDRMVAWFRMDSAPEADVALVLTGLSAPQPAGGEVPGEVRVNDHVVFTGDVPFEESKLSTHTYPVPATALKAGVNKIEVRNLAPDGHTGSRPWFALDRIELGAGQ